MISNKISFLVYSTLSLLFISKQVSGQANTNSRESLIKQLFANNAPILRPQETLELLKSLKSYSKAPDHLANDLDNLIEASDNKVEKCIPDLFVDYITLMRHLDPKTYGLMVVLDYYNGAAWNENIFTYLKYYHNEQYQLCVNSFKEATKDISSGDLKIIQSLAKSVLNGGSNEIAFPLIVPDDIERAVLEVVKPNLKNLDSRESLLSAQGLYRFTEEFDRIKKVCNRFQDSIGEHVQFAQQAYFSYLREKVDNDKFLIKWAFYSDICELINGVSEVQKMEILHTLAKSLDK